MRFGKSLLLLPLLALFVFSCKKVEGPGGKASIKGRLHAQVIDGAGNIINDYDLTDHDVFIIYGDTTGGNYFYDDDLKSSYQGQFEFNYLEVGTYTIYLYEKCPTCPSGEKALFTQVELTEKKEVKDLGTIYVRKNP